MISTRPESSGGACHHLEVRVTYAETDAMGVVYYAHYLRWFEMGRTELMRHLGFPYLKMEGQGFFLPVSEAFCKYLSSARYDDRLVIETRIDFLRRASIQFSYLIRRGADGAELAAGTTLHAFTNREGRIVKIPPTLRQKIAVWTSGCPDSEIHI